MDKKITKRVLYVNAVIVAFFSVFSGDIYAALINNTSLNQDLARPAVLLFAILFILLSEFSVKCFITKSKFIRHRFVRGREFIEGYWFDVVIIPSSKTIRECGLIEISYENDEYVVSGILFNTQAQKIGSFNSRFSKYDGNEIEFAYMRAAEHEKLEEGLGYSRYRFSRSRPFPLDFTGSFYDSSLAEQIHLKGLRITDRKLVKKLKTRNRDDEQSVALSLLSEFIQENNAHRLIHEKI